MSTSIAKIVKWAAASCGIVLIIIAIVCVVCFRNKPSVKRKFAYGKVVYPTAITQTIKATLKCKPNARFSVSTVKLGVQNIGMCPQGSQLFEKKKIRLWGMWGEKQTVQFSISLLDNPAGFFRPAFRIPEGVAVEDIEVTESPAANGEPELTIVEGTILERSAIPDPEKSDYPDCRFTCHFKGNSIVKGKPCPQEMSLILEGFANKKLLGTKDLKAGDRVICLALPFSKLPQERQATQQADDLNLFTLENYYAIDVRKIDEFSDLPGTPASGIAFTDASDKPYVSVFERHVNPTIKEEFRKAQQEAIAQELQTIEAMLAPYTPGKIAELQKSFAIEWEAEKAKDPPGYNRVVRNGKEYVWRNVENSFWALPSDYFLPNYKENPIAPSNLEALIALRDFLEVNGCQLLISPVPDFQEIAARVINQKFRAVPDFHTAYMVKQLLEHGIETFYPSQALIDNFNRHPFAFFYPDNPHPSDTTQDVLTDIVAGKLSRFHFPRTLDSQRFSIKLAPHYYGDANNNYWFPIGCDIGTNKPNSPYHCRQVWFDDKVLLANEKESPILVVGNCYMEYPMRLSQESFPTLLSSKLNITIRKYLLKCYGPMTGMVQQLFASPETMLSQKKIIVLAVGTSHLCASIIFNNIREMDNYAKIMLGKKLIHTYSIKSNIVAYDDKLKTMNISIVSPNYFEIVTNEPMTIINTDTLNIDPDKPIFIVLPTCLDARKSAKYIVNNQEVTIPRSYGTSSPGIYRHLDVFCELPAGTGRLKVEIVGEPGTILSIRNIQVYQ